MEYSTGSELPRQEPLKSAKGEEVRRRKVKRSSIHRVSPLRRINARGYPRWRVKLFLELFEYLLREFTKSV